MKNSDMNDEFNDKSDQPKEPDPAMQELSHRLAAKLYRRSGPVPIPKPEPAIKGIGGQPYVEPKPLSPKKSREITGATLLSKGTNWDPV